MPPGKMEGYKPSKAVRLIYAIIMGMLISKSEALHLKFQPPGSPTPAFEHAALPGESKLLIPPRRSQALPVRFVRSTGEETSPGAVLRVT